MKALLQGRKAGGVECGEDVVKAVCRPIVIFLLFSLNKHILEYLKDCKNLLFNPSTLCVIHVSPALLGYGNLLEIWTL